MENKKIFFMTMSMIIIGLIIGTAITPAIAGDSTLLATDIIDIYYSEEEIQPDYVDTESEILTVPSQIEPLIIEEEGFETHSEYEEVGGEPPCCIECIEAVEIAVTSALAYANERVVLPEIEFPDNIIDRIQMILKGIGQTGRQIIKWIGNFWIGLYLELKNVSSKLPFDINEAATNAVFIFTYEMIFGGYGFLSLAIIGGSLEVIQYLQTKCEGEEYKGGTVIELLPTSTPTSEPVIEPVNQDISEPVVIENTQSGTMSL